MAEFIQSALFFCASPELSFTARIGIPANNKQGGQVGLTKYGLFCCFLKIQVVKLTCCIFLHKMGRLLHVM